MIIKLRNEVWKDFSKPDWRDNEIFKVSNFGRVIKYKFDPEGEFQKFYKLRGFEAFFAIKENRKTQQIYLHRLVAELFLEGEEKPFVIHKDYDKMNNAASNLQYATRAELTAHHNKNPAVIEDKKRRQNNPRYSKLSVGRVKLIKRKIFDPNRKTRMRMIAKQFGISEMQLYRIKSGENWGHVEYE